MAFERLIRFENEEGKTVYGDLCAGIPTEKIQGSTVAVVDGDIDAGFTNTSRRAIVKKV
jgi:transcription initiation factor TFIIH subunit 2